METYGNPFIFVKPLRRLISSQTLTVANGDLEDAVSYDSNDFLHNGILEFNSVFFSYPETTTIIKRATLLIYNTTAYNEKLNLYLFADKGDLSTNAPVAGNTFAFTSGFTADNLIDGGYIATELDMSNALPLGNLLELSVDINRAILQYSNSLQLYGFMVIKNTNPFQFSTGGWVQVILDVEKC